MPKAPMSARSGISTPKADKWQGDKKEFKQKPSFYKAKPPQTHKKYDHEFSKDSQIRRHSIPVSHQQDLNSPQKFFRQSPFDAYRGLFGKLSQLFQTNQLQNQINIQNLNETVFGSHQTFSTNLIQTILTNFDVQQHDILEFLTILVFDLTSLNDQLILKKVLEIEQWF